jgi:small subunit ribosomal protein S17
MAEETPETTEEQAPVDESAAAEAPAEEPAAEPAPAPEAAAPAAPPATPKERKAADRVKRGRRRGATPEERAAIRAQKAAARRRRREQEKVKRGERREGTAPAERLAGTPQVRQGTVVSDKADKTITVRIDIAKRHRRYQKIVRSSMTLHAHDERNAANEGDTVRVVESRPMSRTKRWRLVEILERAK